MIILEIRLLRIKLPLITPYRLSYRTVEAFEPLLVEVRDADGNAGWGEGHISPGSSDETPEGGWAFCHNIAATAAGHDSDAIKASLLDSMAVSPVAAGAFVSAIDMLTGDPLLRPPAEETRLPILAPVNGLTPEALGPEIEEKLASGFRTFKIKVGKDLDGDLRWGVFVTFEAPSDYVRNCFSDYGLTTDSSGRYSALWRPYHLIGLELGISIKTAQTHRAKLMLRVGVRKASALVRYAIREGIVSA